MSAALPQNGDGLHGPCQFPDGFQVFHGEDVVRLRQKLSRRPQDRLRLPLPGGGEGELRLLPHPLPDGRHKGRVRHQLRELNERLKLPGLAAEGEKVHPQRSQHAHGAPGKALRRGEAPGQRQFQHQIRPAAAGRLGPGELGIDRRLAPLHKIPGHGADERRVLPGRLPAGIQLPEVAAVKGIVFADDADGLHAQLSFSFF